MLKPLSLRKQVTLAEAKREEWPLPVHPIFILALASKSNMPFESDEESDKKFDF